MASYHGISSASMHYLLWCRRTTPTTVFFKQATMAAELRVGQAEVTRLVVRLVHEGRLAKTSTRGVYRIVNPAEWTPELVGVAPDRVSR